MRNGRFQVDGIRLLPGGDHRHLDDEPERRAEHPDDRCGLEGPALAEHLGDDGDVREPADDAREPDESDQTDDRPVAPDERVRERARPHDEQPCRHVRRPPPDGAARPVARPAEHRIGEPADQLVRAERERHGEGVGPGAVAHEQREQDPRDRQVRPRPDQAQDQAHEAPQPQAVDLRERQAATPSTTRPSTGVSISLIGTPPAPQPPWTGAGAPVERILVSAALAA